MANVAMIAENARGTLLINRLQDILNRVWVVATHSIRRATGVALAALSVQIDEDFNMEPTGFPMGIGPKDYEDEIEEYYEAAEVVA